MYLQISLLKLWHLKKKNVKVTGVCSAQVNAINVFPCCDRHKTSVWAQNQISLFLPMLSCWLAPDSSPLAAQLIPLNFPCAEQVPAPGKNSGRLPTAHPNVLLPPSLTAKLHSVPTVKTWDAKAERYWPKKCPGIWHRAIFSWCHYTDPSTALR